MTNSPASLARYSIAEAASFLRLSRSTIYLRIAQGQLRVHKDGRRTFVSSNELERYLSAKTCEAPS